MHYNESGGEPGGIATTKPFTKNASSASSSSSLTSSAVTNPNADTAMKSAKQQDGKMAYVDDIGDLVEASDRNTDHHPLVESSSSSTLHSVPRQLHHQYEKQRHKRGQKDQDHGLVHITRKSSLDQREYAVVTLPNGLQALLVSDPETTEAGASMDVNVGYFNDPDDIAGLCHFLEHMLFLGTERYPDEKEYKSFLAQHGGRSNASTSAEHTSYYFSVNADHLDAALDRFSAFFICPLFTESSTKREMEAVNAEFSRNLQSDSRRILQVMKHTSNSANPFSKFSTGNINTLGKYDVQHVRSLLMEKHREFYTADNAKLCVIGRESIEELRSIVEAKFSSMRGALNNMKPIFAERADQHLSPLFREVDLGKMHKIIPINEMRTLSLYWELPSQYCNVDKKPMTFISQMLEQQAPGSLYQYLKNEKHWINGLSAGPYSTSTVLTVFKISISLTEKGLQHTDAIMRHVFEMLRLINLSLETERGHEIYVEMKNVWDTTFRFLEKSSPFGYARSLAKRLHMYPAEDILSLPYDFQRYDPDLIRSIVDLLSPRRMRAYIVAKDMEKQLLDSSTLQTEPIYGTKFTEEILPVKLIEELSAVEANPLFKLPPPNVFIAEKFDVREQRDDASPHPEPVSMINDPYHLLWHNERTEFRHPYVDIVTRMTMSHDHVVNIRGALLLQAYVNHIHNSLSEIAYHASQANVSYGVSYDAYEGIEVSFSGFNDKLPELVKIVFEHIRNPQKVDQDSFNRIKDNMTRYYENLNKRSALDQCTYLSKLVTQCPIYHYDRYLRMIRTITVTELRQFIANVQERMRLESFINGNMSQEEAQKLAHMINDIMQHESMDGMEETPGGVMTLELPASDREYVLESQNTNDNDGNSAVLVHYQIGTRDTRKKVLTEMFARIVRTEFFDEMRTKQQLGYSVHASASVYEEAISYEFEIMAPNHSASEVHSRINQFINERIPVLLSNITDETFEEYRRALTEIKQRPRKRMSEETDALTSEIMFRRFHWTRLSDEAAELQKVTKADVQKFFVEHFTPTAGQMRKLSLLVYGNEKPLTRSTYRAEQEAAGAMTFIDRDHVQEFKITCGRYPLLRKSLKTVLPQSPPQQSAMPLP